MHTEIDLLRKVNLTLSTIAHQLEQLTKFAQPPAPNYRYPLDSYWDFDWAAIDAIVLDRDDDGPTVLLWNNYQWKRRAGVGKFGRAIWFSRQVAGADGATRYLRLVTFKDWEAPQPIDAAIAHAQDAQPALDDSTTSTTLSPPPKPQVGATQSQPAAALTESAALPQPPAIAVDTADGSQRIDADLERWLQEAKHTTTARIFDERFCLAYPQWQHPRNVRLVREQIADLQEIGGARMCTALQQYEQLYRRHKQDGSAEAHDLAIETVRQQLPAEVNGLSV